MSFAIAGTVLTVGATAYAANRAGAAGSAAAGGANNATAESARQYDVTRSDLAPYRVTGTAALNTIGRLFGLPTTTSEQWQSEQPQLVGDTELPPGTITKEVRPGHYDVFYGGQRIGALRPGGANGRFINDTGADIPGLMRQSQQQTQTDNAPAGPDMSAFFESPGYQFRRQEGTRGTERSAAARGGAFSGNALRALAEFNSGLASQEFGNYFNQLSSIAGIGQTATNQTAAYGADHAATAGANARYAGEARASGITDSANAIGQGVNMLGRIGGYYANGRPPSGYGGTGYGGGMPTGYGNYPWTTPGYGDGMRRNV
jgi:hypothetical protein